MRSNAALFAVAAATALVWLAAGELAPGPRFWTAVLVGPFPALMVLQSRMIGASLGANRIPVYVSSIVTLWALALATLLIARTGGFSMAELGIGPVRIGEQLLWAAAITLLGEGLILAGHRLGVRETPVMLELLPRTSGERATFSGLALTAGLCEELVFRGFLVTALAATSGSLLVALVVSAVAFGVVHAYQDPAGAGRATLLGLLLAAPFVATGSLLAPVLAHTAIDLIGGFWLGPRIARAN